MQSLLPARAVEVDVPGRPHRLGAILRQLVAGGPGGRLLPVECPAIPADEAVNYSWAFYHLAFMEPKLWDNTIEGHVDALSKITWCDMCNFQIA